LPRVLLLLAALASPACAPEPGAHYDLLIRDGLIYDGGGGAPYRGSIGVRDGVIVTLLAEAGASADVQLDAGGQVIFPGFIDPHTHALDDLVTEAGRSNLNYLLQGVTTVFVGNDGRGFPDREIHVPAMSATGLGTDVAFFAGHGGIREAVLGMADRAPEADELAAMRAMVAAEMEAGALGLSSGLFYAPGSYAETDEVIELARVAAGYGGVYDSHIRDEASYSVGLVAAVQEVIDVAEAAGLPGHVAHIKALGRDVWGQSEEVVARVEAARERGLQITADQYPWQASGTRLSSSLIPRWVMAESPAAMWARFADPELADGILKEMAANLWRRGGAESLLITGESRWQGLTLEEIAAAMETDPVLAALEVVREGDPSVASFNMQQEDMERFALADWVMTGSDGSSGHPRKYATYPKGYRWLVAESGLMSLEVFVHRSSAQVADTFGLCDRGYLLPGRRADLSVVSLSEYQPVADYDNPTALARGVVHLVLNGVQVIADGKHTGALPGKVVNRRALVCQG
jgi:N-acyl-D-aspartate/D-glutamate deacylase